jgi:hypothetical protein
MAAMAAARLLQEEAAGAVEAHLDGFFTEAEDGGDLVMREVLIGAEKEWLTQIRGQGLDSLTHGGSSLIGGKLIMWIRSVR